MGIDLLEDVFDLADASPGMNDDLAAWAAEHGAHPEEAAVSRAIRGPCYLCERPGDRRCVRCEETVCLRHHHVMVGLCDPCRAEPDGEKDQDVQGGHPLDEDALRDERPPPRAELDLDWIE